MEAEISVLSHAKSALAPGPAMASSASGLLVGKLALVTGASSGIGLAVAKMFVREGAKVCATGRNEAALQVRKVPSPYKLGQSARLTA